jgi:hypothetical protein
MSRKEVLERIERWVELFRVTKGRDFRLKDFDPRETLGLKMDQAELSHAPGRRHSEILS